MNKRRKVVVVALIIFSSFITSLLFQNCSGGLQSQAELSSLTGDDNTSSATPNPGALPAGCTGNPPASVVTQVSQCPSGQSGTGTVSIVDYTCVGTTYQPLPARQVTSCMVTGTSATPLTPAEIGNICDDYLVNVTPTFSNSASAVSFSSGLGNGNTGVGNGDGRSASMTATVNANIPASSQQIKPPYKYVTGARSDAELNCNYTTSVTCEVLPDDPETDITQAYPLLKTSPYYGKNAASVIKGLTDATKKAADWSTLVKNIIPTGRSTDGSTCTFDFQNAFSTRSQVYSLGNNRRDEGYLCVQGKIRIRMKAKTSHVNGTTESNNSAWSYYTVTLNENCWDESKLVPNPATLPSLANYGNVVTASSNWIAVLSPSDTEGTTTQVGAVSIFDKNNLNLTPFRISLPGLVGGGASSGGDITVSAALAGDWIAISSFNRLTYAGQVMFYVFENGSWNRKGSILKSGLATDKAKFGYALALSTNGLLAVGAPFYTNTASTGTGDLSGRVYLYSCSSGGCNPLTQISNGNVGALFGASLSLSGNRLVVGAPYSTAQSDSHGDGFVRVYDISGSTATQVGNTILPPGDLFASTGPKDIQISNPVEAGGVKAGRAFGSSVSVSGNKLLVGAPNKSRLSGTTLIPKVGEAYFYPDFPSYVNQDKTPYLGVVILKNDNAPFDSRYGQGVAMNTNGVFTGCPYCQNNMGQVYHFPFSGGTISDTYTRSVFPNDRIPRDGFGNSIFANDVDLVVGASNRPQGGSDQAGAAYRFVAP